MNGPPRNAAAPGEATEGGTSDQVGAGSTRSVTRPADIGPAGARLTKAERADLARLARQRGRVAKAALEERRRILAADVEDQLAAEYKFDDDAWAEVNRQAKAAVDAANRRIVEACATLGIPEQFAPALNLSWYSRGENALASRRAELRKLAAARIEAAVAAAKTAIDAATLDVETQLVADGLTTDRARAFLESMPTPEALMPRVEVERLERGEEPRRWRSRYGSDWEPPDGAAADLLTPTTATARDERRRRIAAALTANPDASDRAIGRLVGADHKTVGKMRGEIPATAGEVPATGETSPAVAE